jgi:hypothetical protein
MKIMQKAILLLLILYGGQVMAQSKSITRFRSDYKETSNMFFYSSTLKMLNTAGNPELAGLLDDIEEIRVLNYVKEKSGFSGDDIAGLKNALREETYNSLMMINEHGNRVELYGREKKGKMVGMVALVDSQRELVLVDLTGSIDIEKFMELMEQIRHQKVNSE